MMPIRKVALVTGAGQTTSRGIALRLAKEGADIVLVDKDVESLKPTLDQIIAMGRRASAFMADMTGPQVFREAIEHAEKMFGRVDILVNNPGLPRAQGDMTLGYEEVERLINYNISCTFWGIQAAANIFRQRCQKGTIINISSSTEHDHQAIADVLSASRMAVRAMTQAACKELKADGITVTLQCFGSIIPVARYV
jgi:meso-butanediol dehydrogenase/(S,S)-butanediol dehydrogenase/diacetyl reductase